MPENIGENLIPAEDPKIPEEKQILSGTEEEKAEEELSPEIIEMVMAKVQDINKPETGYTSVMRRVGIFEKLNDILQQGLLGDAGETPVEAVVPTSKKWKEQLRLGKNPIVHFNITGRHAMSMDVSGAEFNGNTIEDSYYFTSDGDKLGILFDIAQFEEKEPASRTKFVPEKRMFRLNDVPSNTSVSLYKKWRETEFDPQKMKEIYKGSVVKGVDTEYGFTLSSRIAPRFFKGIFIKVAGQKSRKEVEEYEKKRGSYQVFPREDEKVFPWKERKYYVDSTAKQIVSTMVKAFSKKPELFIPIYDVQGNLLWPKQMNYEEVKKFVEERERQEKEEDK